MVLFCDRQGVFLSIFAKKKKIGGYALFGHVAKKVVASNMC